jgi:isoleucyl-tRNA synthetase
MKVKGEDNTYLLVWTTTPWTLLANVAVCVNPKEKYVKAESMGYNFIVAKALLGKVLGEDAKIVKEYTGKELEHMEYEQLLPFIEPSKKAFYVVCDDYVSMEDGTGLVHIAPHLFKMTTKWS